MIHQPGRVTANRSVREREFGVQRGANADRAVDGDAAAQRFDPVFEADQPGAPVGVGAAVTVVADPEVKNLVGCLGTNVDG